MKTRTKVIIAVSSAVAVIGIGVGTFFLVKHISDQNYQHRLEMAVGCAKSYEMPIRQGSFMDAQVSNQYWNEVYNNRAKKLEECSAKYDITQGEITNKIGTDNY